MLLVCKRLHGYSSCQSWRHPPINNPTYQRNTHLNTHQCDHTDDHLHLKKYLRYFDNVVWPLTRRRAWFMTYTATRHQGAINMFWLPFWEPSWCPCLYTVYIYTVYIYMVLWRPGGTVCQPADESLPVPVSRRLRHFMRQAAGSEFIHSNGRTWTWHASSQASYRLKTLKIK